MDIFNLKTAVSILVTAGVGKVIDDAIDATAPENVKLPAKVLRKIGSWSLGWFIGDWAGEKTEQAFDVIESSVKEIGAKVKEISETIESEETDTSETDEDPDPATDIFETEIDNVTNLSKVKP